MKPFILFLLFFTLLLSCLSPEKAYKDRYYKTAMQLAANEIKKGKDSDANKEILQNSVSKYIEGELSVVQYYLNSQDVAQWKKAQDQLYINLEIIGKANINSGYLITENYNNLCNYKKDLDFKIVNHYYQNGIKEIKLFDASGTKANARNAFYFFNDAINSGGQIYFDDLLLLKDYSLENGVVYYTVNSNFDIGSSTFLQKLPNYSNAVPDCEVNVSEGFVSFSTSEYTTTTDFEKEVEIGSRSEKDTSGNIITIPIYETKKAKLIKKTVKVSASQTIYVYVTNRTGQCSISDHSFSDSVEKSYDVVSAEGYKEAITESYIEGSNEPILINSSLEDELEDEIMSSIRNYYK